MGYGWNHWAVVRGRHGHTHRLCEYASFHTMGYGRLWTSMVAQQGGTQSKQVLRLSCLSRE